MKKKKNFHRSTLILFMNMGLHSYLKSPIKWFLHTVTLSAISRFRFVEVILFTSDTKGDTSIEFQSSLASR